MIIYHGGYCEVKEPRIIKGRFAKDFGDGFYCTEIKEQAKRWCLKFDEPMISSYEYTEDKSLNLLRFETMTEEWLDFIISCRSGESHDYDIVVGTMANDQIYNFIIDYIDGIISRAAFWELAKFKYPTHQIAFCTKKALLCIKFVKSEAIDKNDISRRPRI